MKTCIGFILTIKISSIYFYVVASGILIFERFYLAIGFDLDVGFFEFSLHAVREFTPKAALGILATHNTFYDYPTTHGGCHIKGVKATLEIPYESSKHCTLTTNKTTNTKSNNNKNCANWTDYFSGITNATVFLDFFRKLANIARCGSSRHFGFFARAVRP